MTPKKPDADAKPAPPEVPRSAAELNTFPGGVGIVLAGSPEFDRLGKKMERRKAALGKALGKRAGLTGDDPRAALAPSIQTLAEFEEWLTEELTVLRISRSGWLEAVRLAYLIIKDGLQLRGYPARPANLTTAAECEDAIVDLLEWARNTASPKEPAAGDRKRAGGQPAKWTDLLKLRDDNPDDSQEDLVNAYNKRYASRITKSPGKLKATVAKLQQAIAYRNRSNGKAK